MNEMTAKSQLIDYIGSRIPLLDQDASFIKDRFHLRSFSKKQFFLKEGDEGFEQGFIVAGAFRIFYTDPKGLEHVLYFGFKDWWVGDLGSFLSSTKSQLNVQALEDGYILAFNHADIEEIFTEVPKMERLFRVMAQRTLSVLQKRFFLTVSASAEDRYLDLLKRHPKIEQMVPQHQIASYLGILPESLSRLKKQMIQRIKSAKAGTEEK